MDTRPLVIGVAGPSCSGKTSLARRLVERLPGGGLVFELDWYYHDQAGVSHDDIEVDIPGAIDHELLVAQLRRLVDGHAIERPVYDYTSHTRAREGAAVRPAPNIVVEGLFALYWPELSEIYDRTVFILADHDTCLERRVARDVRERGRTVDQVTRQYRRKVEPMYEKHVHPTRRHAELLLRGEDSIEHMAARVLELVRDTTP